MALPPDHSCKEDYAMVVRTITPIAWGGDDSHLSRSPFNLVIGPCNVGAIGVSLLSTGRYGGIIHLTLGCEVGVTSKRKPDPKEQALAQTRTLNPRPEAVRHGQVGSSEFCDARDVVQVKYEMVRRVRVDGTPVTAAAAAFGFSRPSYYEAAAAVDRDGLGGLVSAKPGPRGAHKLTDEGIAYAPKLRDADPGIGSARLADAIAEKFAIRVHPRSVERAMARAENPKSGGLQ